MLLVRFSLLSSSLLILFHITIVCSTWWSRDDTRVISKENAKDRFHCSKALKKEYNTVVLGKNAQDRQWCLDTQKKHGTIIGKRFGKMSTETRNMWINSKCEEQILFKQALTCEQRLGWYFFGNWLKQRYKNKSLRTDGIECASSHKTNVFCKMSNATLDFSHVTIVNGARRFTKGFAVSYGTAHAQVNPSPGYLYRPTASLLSEHIPAMADCDEWEERPAFVLSNDDPFNLSHYMNDVMMMWSMLVLAGRTGTNTNVTRDLYHMID